MVHKQMASEDVCDLRSAFADLDRPLASADVEMKDLDKAKSDFIAVAAHELRSPLTVIAGYLDLLLDGADDSLTDRQREYLAFIRESADHLLGLTQELFDLLRIETGRIELQLQAIDSRELICSVITTHQAKIAEKRHRLTMTLAADLPAIRCDPQRAFQILGNVLCWAIKQAPPGGEIAFEVGPAAEEGFLQIRIRDGGVGITDAGQKLALARFLRARSMAEADRIGGLGLYVARALAELHGGRLWLESTKGGGIVVYMTFPLAISTANSVQSASNLSYSTERSLPC